MRLKKFKDFIYRSDIDTVIQNTEDIFDHLRDFDFDIKVEEHSHQNESSEYPDGYIEEEISFRIVKYNKSSFELEGTDEESIEVKESVLRAKDIMKDWRLQMEVRFMEDLDSPTHTGISSAKLKSKDVKLQDDVFVNSAPPSNKLDYPIFVLRVYFTRKSPVLTKHSPCTNN
jgi:hypothetical protein